MSLRITQITPALGAIVDGIDLSQTLSGDQLAFLNDALVKHQILFFKISRLHHKNNLILQQILVNYMCILFIRCYPIYPKSC